MRKKIYCSGWGAISELLSQMSFFNSNSGFYGPDSKNPLSILQVFLI
ncbi:hypothetical protein [Leptospira borgpetersenii]|nr:hypothetical protein [Leptospira borgpetersenii]